MIDQDRLLTVKEAANRLRMSETKFRRMYIELALIPVVRLDGERMLIRLGDLLSLIDSHTYLYNPGHTQRVA